jgi:uncharacterized protein
MNIETLASDVGRVLLGPAPDVAALAARLGLEQSLSPADTERFVYHIVAELNQAFFPPITKMELVLAEGCNLACAYCFEKGMRGKRKMSPGVARAAVDLLLDYSRDESAVEITHFGGEPLLNFPTLADATQYAASRASATGKSIELSITTNGTLLNESIADYLVEHGVKVLLSIDGLAPSHDRYRLDRQGRGTFEAVLAALTLLKQRQQWIGVKMTVMPDNAPRLFDDVLGLHALGANQFVIGHATGMKWTGDEIALYGREMQRLCHWYRQSPRDGLKISEFDDQPAAEAHFGCQAGRDSISVSPAGEISSCSKVLALNNRQLIAKMGDVRHGVTHLGNRAQLVNCSRLRSACEELGIAGDYRGGCLATNYEESGDLYQPSLADHAFSMLARSVHGAGVATLNP